MHAFWSWGSVHPKNPDPSKLASFWGTQNTPASYRFIHPSPWEPEGILRAIHNEVIIWLLRTPSVGQPVAFQNLHVYFSAKTDTVHSTEFINFTQVTWSSVYMESLHKYINCKIQNYRTSCKWLVFPFFKCSILPALPCPPEMDVSFTFKLHVENNTCLRPSCSSIFVPVSAERSAFGAGDNPELDVVHVGFKVPGTSRWGRCLKLLVMAGPDG